MDRHLGPQSVYQLFAENLRRHCNRFESIAAFCRKSGINRQQFNRYLSGQNLPNPRSLSRICATLGVTETSLFESHSLRAGGAMAQSEELAALQKFTVGLSHRGIEALTQAAAAFHGPASIQGKIQPGIYISYMPMAGYPGRLLRAVLKVSRIGGLTVFTRRTSFRTPRVFNTAMTVGKHVGLVVSDSLGTMFLGMNQMHPHEISVMRVMHSISDQQAPRLGLTLVRSPCGDLACKIVLTWIGKGVAAERKALALLGVTEIGDPSLPPLIAAMLPNEPCNSQTHDYLEVTEILQAHQQMNAIVQQARA